MSDLVTELRSTLEQDCEILPGHIAERCHDAANEIERLRAENGRIRECLRVNLLRHVPGLTHEAVDDMLAKIEALYGRCEMTAARVTASPDDETH